MNLHDRRSVRLLDVATIERAKAGKTYPAGSTIVQVSATEGQARYLAEPSEVEGKYAVIEPTDRRVYPPYLFFVIERELPRFLHTYQTTLNIQMEAFDHMVLDMHADYGTQRAIVELFVLVDGRIEQEARTIERLKDLKTWHLDTMSA